MDSATSVGTLSSTRPDTLAGTLAVWRTAGFNPAVGTTIPILTAPSLSGAWTRVTGAVIGGGRYFLPTYSATGASLLVEQAQLSIAPTSGPPGTRVALAGTNFPLSSTVRLNLGASSRTPRSRPRRRAGSHRRSR